MAGWREPAERLRRRLTARGVTVPAGLLVAGTAGQAQAAIPASLAHSTVRIAHGFMAGKTAGVLARGVLNTMLLNQLKIATVLLFLGFGGRYWAWNAVAGLIDDGGQAEPGAGRWQDARRGTGFRTQVPNNPADGSYRLSGRYGLTEPVSRSRGRSCKFTWAISSIFRVRTRDWSKVVPMVVLRSRPPGRSCSIRLAEPPDRLLLGFERSGIYGIAFDWDLMNR